MNRTIGGVALVLALAGCGGSERTADQQVCRDLAVYARDGQRAEDRPALVAKIGERIGGADERLRAAHGGLERALGGSDSGFRLAADVFAKTCQDLGVDVN